MPVCCPALWSSGRLPWKPSDTVGHVEAGRLLIEQGADPNHIVGDAGGNALHAAASMRYTDDARRFIEMLLEAGADVNARTAKGKTALALAAAGARKQEAEPAADPGARRKRFSEVAELLRRRGGTT